MIYSLNGKIVHKDAAGAAIECGGVAYYCSASLNTLKQLGDVGANGRVFTYMSVREDAVELYGFIDKDELALFRLLIGVSGVGPKAALSVLSVYSPAALSLRIAQGDVKAIRQAPGVGPKIAQRLILELKDKITRSMPEHLSSDSVNTGEQLRFGGNISEAISALSTLGFSPADAAAALRGADEGASVEALIKFALQRLAGN